MPSATSEILAVLCPLLWSALNAVSWINPRFRLVLSSLDRVSELCDLVGVQFCRGLLAVLRAPSPPSIQWFLSLPSERRPDMVWAVYAIILRKRNRRHKLYIGSATNFLRGVRARFEEYDNERALPYYIKKALQDGYTIERKVLLATCPIPVAAKVPAYRILVLALEAILACYFWSMFHRDHDYGFNNLCPWNINLFTYDGACSHNPLKEGFKGEVDLTEEQLQQIADDIKVKNLAYGRAYHKQQRVDATPEFKAAQAKANKKQRPKTQQKRREAVANKTWYCPICDFAGGDKDKLRQHKESKLHIRRVQDQEN